MRQPILLLCRPERQSLSFQAEVEARLGGSVECVISPAFSIEELVVEPPNHDGPLIFTSPNAVACAQNLNLSLPRLAYCVGDATTDAAREAGFDTRNAKGTNAELVQLILNDKPVQPLLHISGEQVTGDLVGDLNAAGLKAERLIVYRQVQQPPAAAFLQAVEGSGRAVLPVFSPRSTLILAELNIGSGVQFVAMSENVASEVVGLGGSNIHVARSPDLSAMIDLTCELLS